VTVRVNSEGKSRKTGVFASEIGQRGRGKGAENAAEKS
jgi:hypothetical protein